jgi:hypothetical protein
LIHFTSDDIHLTIYFLVPGIVPIIFCNLVGPVEFGFAKDRPGSSEPENLPLTFLGQTLKLEVQAMQVELVCSNVCCIVQDLHHQVSIDVPTWSAFCFCPALQCSPAIALLSIFLRIFIWKKSTLLSSGAIGPAEKSCIQQKAYQWEVC